jgi:hypothetical protein
MFVGLLFYGPSHGLTTPSDALTRRETRPYTALFGNSGNGFTLEGSCGMKSERRHELQHNELAEWLFKTGEQLKPYQNLILTMVALAVVAVAIYSWWSRTAATRASQAWAELNNGLQVGPDALANVADENPNTVVGQTARVILGDIHLAEGCKQRFLSMALAQKELSSAIDSYQRVLDKSRSSSLLERATYGMARAKETQGALEDATQHYKEVAEKWPDGAYAAAAKRRLADFQTLDTKLMFGDLRKYEPKPAFTEEPSALGLPSNFGEPSMPQEPPVGPGAAPGGLLPGETEKTPPATATQPKAGVGKASDAKKNEPEKKK